MNQTSIDRRAFVTGVAASVMWAASGAAQEPKPAEPPELAPAPGKRIRVGVIGCGSVSQKYLPHLARCPHVELVSVCDIKPERAAAAGKRFNVPNQYPHIDAMLAGAAFDLMVNLTDMQEHERLNRQAVEAGKHVWSEKPLANSLKAGQELLAAAVSKGVKLWGAPVVTVSPQFAFMAQTLKAGLLGRLAAAHASYGHRGPNWSSFFYDAGGGSLPDLGVYQLTTLTGLLGPARSVAAMTSIVTPTRNIRGKGDVAVAAEDNAMVLMDHGDGVISHVQSGFNYFNPHPHDVGDKHLHTLNIVGTNGAMAMVGYDWEPHGVDVATVAERSFKRQATERGDYVWEMGASLAAESLATGRPLLVTAEHALHVLEVIEAARESQATGRRVELRSTFAWPIVG